MFTWFADEPLLSRRQWMELFIRVARQTGVTDVRAACVCMAMCVFQEAGGDPHKTGVRHIWVPGNHADPCFAANPGAFKHDSLSDDGRSVGAFQQQTSGPGAANPWGWGGLYGDPEGTRKRMDPQESAALFLAELVKVGVRADSPAAANDSVQKVQRSGFPHAYEQWWGEANRLYDEVAGNGGSVAVDTGWVGDPVWLADQLERELGKSRVRVLPGWDKRGHGDFKDIRGIMFHHSGNAKESAESIRDGRPDLPGPLSQLHISPEGVVTVVAVGVAWHAGVGSLPWVPTNMGNWHLIGVECAWPRNTRLTPATQHTERWPDKQIIAMRDVAAAVCKRLGFGADRVTTHKEYAGRAQGKWDPGNLDPAWFRGEVAKDLAGVVFPGEGSPEYTPPPVPAPTPPQGGYADVLLYRGMSGPKVRALQKSLKRFLSKLVVDGVFGPETENAVRWYQSQPYRRPPLVVDGIVGPQTAAQLGLVV